MNRLTGLIDVGGGMRDVYGTGVLDCFIDNNISFDLCIGVSAGSANIASFLAGQRGRNYRFYTEYAMRKEYMGIEELIKNGSYINLDYIYSTLTNSDGEDPIDFDALMASPAKFLFVTTKADTGEAVFFSKNDMVKDDFWFFKASCAVPIACKPYAHNGKEYFDGGVADPIPIEKAFELGCDKVVVIIPRPIEEKKHEHITLMKPFLKHYPAMLQKIEERPEIYNGKLEKLRHYQEEGKVILISPDSDKGLNMVSKNAERLDAYYKKGYSDAMTAVDKIREASRI